MTAGVDWDQLRSRLAKGREAFNAAQAIDGARLEALLLARARQLAEPATTRRDRTKSAALVVRAGNERYALELAHLAGVVPFRSSSPVPNSSPELLGVVAARGDIWAIFDFRLLFAASRSDATEGGYALLMRHDRRRVSLRVDDVERVCDLTQSNVAALDDRATGVPIELVDGATADSVILVRLDTVWNHPAIREAT